MTRPSAAALGIAAGLTAVVAATSAGVVALSRVSPALSSPGLTSGAIVGPSAPAGTPAVSPVATATRVSRSAAAAVEPVSNRFSSTPPDAVVRVDHAVTAHQVRRLQADSGVRAVAVLDRGRVSVKAGHRTVRLTLGAAPVSEVRGFTPRITAVSTPLWRSVAAGELTVAFASSQSLRHRLGATLPVTGSGRSTTALRIGAFATLDVPGIQGLVSTTTAAALHLQPSRELLVQAPRISLAALHADVLSAVGRLAAYTVTRVEPFDQADISSYATSTIPTSYLDLYRRAAPTCPGLPWTVLAGIGTVETDNGRDVHRSVKGAEGPMQFLPSTWAEWGVDADGDGKADIQDPVDAVFSAARYLCAAGAGRGGQALKDAIFAYNHAWWYVREVVVLADDYA